ncbi:unnamed protein product, partial [Brenthis ino]
MVQGLCTPTSKVEGESYTNCNIYYSTKANSRRSVRFLRVFTLTFALPPRARHQPDGFGDKADICIASGPGSWSHHDLYSTLNCQPALIVLLSYYLLQLVLKQEFRIHRE